MIDDNSNISLDIRPRFELNSSLEIKEIHERFQAKLKKKEGKIRGKLRHGYINLYHNEENHQYWSPHLSVIV